ncbi:hypothetical protein H0H92_004097 [Tricholoma furcatifolium]|nr:hypothetical protein H0H92_004097 [Tricholoma furcatifolium]
MEYNPPLNISSSYYDDFVFTHMDLGEVVHATGRFFPWHRAYVHTLETAMKRQCNYQGVSPYWNWSIDAADFYNSPMFANSDPESGLGGWGDPYADASVLDGAFSATSGFALSYPYPHTLKRNFTLRPFMDYPDPEQWHVIPDKMANESFSSEQVSRAIDSWVGDFRGFQTDVEAIQMVDKIWYEWQRRHPENLDAFSGGSIQAVGPAQSDMYPVGTPPDLNVRLWFSLCPTIAM